ncbi:riboflavin synthase, alpha subunit [Paenibacillus curdlanolyticus YK9]|uniref:Riboflavin synthase n=1 Tax=Paenibacillus curdlanolyticus YK9 TaxID=717606 RepID=E0ICE4_9BACL|nr:riboflavin synthase [Paenibacillus curdlanolyticus]EFM09830.1 riboflavin synthase, alpha subunit [Paenibacillus curdlanolyticus YK9]
MFTGLIEEVGRFRGASRAGEAMVLTIDATRILGDVAIGDSIAVNGVCLTVTSFTRGSFQADVMPQTYRHSNLKDLKPGSKVNLERAMAAGGRFGGHIVQGHIDGIGVIVSRKVDANAVIFKLRAEESSELAKYVIPKGSITIDGISLTVTEAESGSFGVSIIPHTLAETALQDKQPGDTVNLEADIIGKYVDHLLHYRTSEPTGKSSRSGISASFLADNGFF